VRFEPHQVGRTDGAAVITDIAVLSTSDEISRFNSPVTKWNGEQYAA
jgi:hypothetical protein